MPRVTVVDSLRGHIDVTDWPFCECDSPRCVCRHPQRLEEGPRSMSEWLMSVAVHVLS